VPTTLLAQADAAIGGKCAVDLVQDGHLLKNVAGTFYPAQEMWLFTGWWRSLPARERRSGLAEVLKILWLFAKPTPVAGLRDWCDSQTESSAGLDRLLKTAIALKQKIVLKDPKDHLGLRANLNFGHSIGHALESLSQGKLSHGEAIAWGMWAECELAGSRFAKDIYKTLGELGYEFPQVSGSPQAWEKLLVQDKKMRSKKLPLIYLTAPGKIKILALTPKVVARKSMQLFA
jgi:3-dehydroquinate synthase